MKTTNKSPKALHVQVAEKLIEQLKGGTAPWQKPWNAEGVPVFQLPYNALTGNRYKGINSLALMMSGYRDPRWVTYRQASASGWQVKKGEKGRSEEHTSELQSLMRISYAVFCLKKKTIDMNSYLRLQKQHSSRLANVSTNKKLNY